MWLWLWREQFNFMMCHHCIVFVALLHSSNSSNSSKRKEKKNGLTLMDSTKVRKSDLPFPFFTLSSSAAQFTQVNYYFYFFLLKLEIIYVFFSHKHSHTRDVHYAFDNGADKQKHFWFRTKKKCFLAVNDLAFNSRMQRCHAYEIFIYYVFQLLRYCLRNFF